jgi:DNA-binding phage protein
LPNALASAARALYKALAPEAKPRYDTVLKVLHSLGVKLTVSVAWPCDPGDDEGHARLT